MKALVIFLAGLIAGAGTLFLFTHAQRDSVDGPSSALQPSEASSKNAQEPLATNSRQNQISEAVLPSSDASAPVQTMDEWDAVAGGMLEWEVEHQSGQQLTAQQRERLLQQLARLRDASTALQDTSTNAADADSVRNRLVQTLTLVEADRAFQEIVGKSVSEFLNEANVGAGAIEEVPRGTAVP